MKALSTYDARMSLPAVALAGLAALAVGMGIGRFAFTPVLPMMQAERLALACRGRLARGRELRRLPRRRAVRAAPVARCASRSAPASPASRSPRSPWRSERASRRGSLLRALAGVASAWVLVHVSAWCLQRLLGSACMRRRLRRRRRGQHARRRRLPRLAPLRTLGARGRGLLLGVVSLAVDGGSLAGVLPATVSSHVGGRHALGWRNPALGALLRRVRLRLHHSRRRSSRRLRARRCRTRRSSAGPGRSSVRRRLHRPRRDPLAAQARRAPPVDVGHLVMAAGVAAPLVLAGLAGILICGAMRRGHLHGHHHGGAAGGDAGSAARPRSCRDDGGIRRGADRRPCLRQPAPALAAGVHEHATSPPYSFSSPARLRFCQEVALNDRMPPPESRSHERRAAARRGRARGGAARRSARAVHRAAAQPGADGASAESRRVPCAIGARSSRVCPSSRC